MKIAILIDNPMYSNLPHPIRVINEAETLANNGYDVTIFCKKEKDYCAEEQTYKNIKIVRCFDYFLGTSELIHNYIISHIQLFEAIKGKFDVYHCHDTNTLPIGYILSKRDNAKLIFEPHEYFLEQICSEWYGNNKLKYNLTKNLVEARGKYYKYADEIIVVSNPIADALYSELNLNKRPTVLYNTRKKVDFEKVQYNCNEKSIRERFNISKDKKILFFQGYLEPARGIDIVIKAMNYVENAVFIAAGADKYNYINELQAIVKENKLEDKVYFTGFETSSQLLKYTYDSDILVYLGKPTIRNMEYTIPNKFFDYLYSCKPMILSDLYALKDMVKNNKIGITVDMHNINIEKIGIKINGFVNNNKFIEEIYNNMRVVRELYTWEKEENKLINLYKGFNI